MRVFDIEVDGYMVKGFVHAIVLPIIISVIVYFIEKQFSVIGGIAYLMFAFVVYSVIYHTSDEQSAANWFFNFAIFWVTIVVIIGLLIVSSTLGA